MIAAKRHEVFAAPSFFLEQPVNHPLGVWPAVNVIAQKNESVFGGEFAQGIARKSTTGVSQTRVCEASFQVGDMGGMLFAIEAIVPDQRAPGLVENGIEPARSAP